MLLYPAVAVERCRKQTKIESQRGRVETAVRLDRSSASSDRGLSFERSETCLGYVAGLMQLGRQSRHQIDSER